MRQHKTLSLCWLCVCFSMQMRFSLYLYGNFNGSLLVAIEEDGTTTAPLVWERNGQWTDDWVDVALQLTGLEHGQVKTKGKRSRWLCKTKVQQQKVHGLVCIKVTSYSTLLTLFFLLFVFTWSSVIFPFPLKSSHKDYNCNSLNMRMLCAFLQVQR